MKKYSVPSLKLSGFAVFIFTMMVFVSGCSKQEMTSPSSTPPPDLPISTSIPKTPGVIVDPPDNPSSPAKIELGRHLFFDKQLSIDNTTSCGSCHQVKNGFSDIFPTSIGMGQHHGTRNAPALANIAYNTALTWDGRFKSLEEHAPGPIFNSVEMGNNFSTTPQDTVPSGYNSDPGSNDTNFLFSRIDGQPRSKQFGGLTPGSTRKDSKGNNYYALFTAAWGDSKVTLDRIAKSIACFERTFISTQSDFDRFNNGDQSVYKNSEEAVKAARGLNLFMDAKAGNCISCHSGYNFTDQQYHDNGIGLGSDVGRANIKNDPSNVGKFKTPSLRNIALTGPYMHDGRFATLDEVLQSYAIGGKTPNDNTEQSVKSIRLSKTDIADIVAFLNTLTDYNFVQDKTNKFSNPWNN